MNFGIERQTANKIISGGQSLPHHLPPSGASRDSSGVLTPNMSDTKAKTVLKEAVDAVVNSFAKHTHGCGRG